MAICKKFGYEFRTSAFVLITRTNLPFQKVSGAFCNVDAMFKAFLSGGKYSI